MTLLLQKFLMINFNYMLTKQNLWTIKIELKALDYYDEFSKNNYSTQISNDKLLMNEKRDKLIQFICGINYHTKNRIIFLIGCQKIGLTFTIKICLKTSNILYINIEDINKIEKTSDKRKYLFYMFFNLFNDFMNIIIL